MARVYTVVRMLLLQRNRQNWLKRLPLHLCARVGVFYFKGVGMRSRGIVGLELLLLLAGTSLASFIFAENLFLKKSIKTVLSIPAIPVIVTVDPKSISDFSDGLKAAAKVIPQYPDRLEIVLPSEIGIPGSGLKIRDVPVETKK